MLRQGNKFCHQILGPYSSAFAEYHSDMLYAISYVFFTVLFPCKLWMSETYDKIMIIWNANVFVFFQSILGFIETVSDLLGPI